ncbi:MAG TPA: carboxypeptidase-like regulatory domain-containing protein, partial [Bryobacteraceae bacterium]
MKPFSGLKTSLTSGVLLIALASLFTGAAFAQTTGAGTITGSISDPSGSAVPGAVVDILNTDTGVARSITTNEAGNYVAQFLQPGPYQVSVSKEGFAKLVRKDLSLQVGQILSVDLGLTLKTTTDTITVEGASSVVDSEKTDVSQTISQNQKDSLPVSGRRWDTFVLMTPNVTTDGTSGLVSYRGISGIYNGNTVDGANNNQALFSEARGRALSGAYVYSLDSIQEYQVSASNYSAELGQAAGGIVNAVTKSGSNVIHGDLFYYLRYPTWNALDPLPKSQGNYTQPIHQWQQFGAS